MTKTILITGSTDGIGLLTARTLSSCGHHVLLHGRNPEKLKAAEAALAAVPNHGSITSYAADLSDLHAVAAFAQTLLGKHNNVDVLINNAGVYNTSKPLTDDGFDIRFVVNTIAPYLLATRLLPILGQPGRIINLSSAAQAPVDLNALAGKYHLSDHAAYAQSKLALTMWSRHMAQSLGDQGATVIAVNPGSMLGSKMVKQAFGVAGADLSIGSDILCRAALDDDFAAASGRYFDNDKGAFAPPHPDGLDLKKCAGIVELTQQILTGKGL